MTGIVGPHKTDTGTVFKYTINSATLPTITTLSVPAGKTWMAFGVAKEQEAAAYSVTGACDTGRCVTTASCSFGAGGGVEGGADDGTAGGCQGGGHNWERHCARWCAHYCARYCARYCGLAGYGYGFAKGYGFGFGYGYSYARGYSEECIAIATRGSSSWTQILPSGFTVSKWLYAVETTTAD